MNLDDAPWDTIPAHMQAGLRRYIEEGAETGDFLYAVLTNNLRRAVEKADDTNRAALANYVTFLFNSAPRACWGSSERVRDWMTNGGLNGQKQPEEAA